MDTIKKNRGKKPTIDIFREVCEAKAGIAGDIAAALNIRRSTLYGWLKNDPEFSAVFDEAQGENTRYGRKPFADADSRRPEI